MTGHAQLLADLRALLADAERFEYHDHRNTTFATPKVALAARLAVIRDFVLKGRYDNRPEDEAGA
jgi:hypothetical protein